MDITVCIKQVPDPQYYPQIVLDPVTKVVRREGIPVITNPVDRNAIEAALQLREQHPSKVTVITMGPPQARSALEDALAMGADEALLLCDRAFAGADALVTSHTLAAAITKFCPCDLVLCGNETADSGTGQVGPQLAEWLDLPHAPNVTAIGLHWPDSVVVESSMGCRRMKIALKLPSLLAVTPRCNEPRVPCVSSILAASSKEIKTISLADLGLPADEVVFAGSPTRMMGMVEFRNQRRAHVLKGSPQQVCGEAVDRLRKLRLI